MAARLQAFSWADHPLGPPEAWPSTLKVALGICLHSSLPTAIHWGPELRLLYNDAWVPVPADRHPAAIGGPTAQVWRDIWPMVGPQFDRVIREGKGVSTTDQPLALKRRGVVEQTYWSYSLTPILDDDGKVVGVFNQGQETTDQVVKSRNQTFLLQIGDQLRDLASGQSGRAETLSAVLEAIGRHLGLVRTGYSELEGEGVGRVVGWWSLSAPADAPPDRFTLAEFGARPMAEMLAGGVLSSEAVGSDPLYTAEEAKRLADYGVVAQLIAPIVRQGRTIGFLFLNADRPRRWSDHDRDLAREAVERIWLALDRADAAARLRESERRFSVIFDQASVGLSEIDVDGRFVRVNESMGRLLARSPAEIAGLSVSEITHHEDVAETSRSELEAASDDEDSYTLEKRYLRPDGSAIWAVTNVTRIVDEAGEPAGFFSVTTDVSERVEQERIKGWLLAELNHRVRNNLATVQALAHQTRLATSSSEEFEAVFNARLMALSRAHDVLTRETWTSAGLSDLVSGTLAPYVVEGQDRIRITGPEIRLSPTAAVTLNLAFHELATNAAKFGALSSPEGRVAVTWTVDGARPGGALQLEWRETNGPPVGPPGRRGFGLRLIERGAPRELGGVATLAFDPGGIACAFQLPLSQKIMTP
ncbi:MAG TPA: HWE histidine kinase domain-containing protein [Hansschlegelia sp.]